MPIVPSHIIPTNTATKVRDFAASCRLIFKPRFTKKNQLRWKLLFVSIVFVYLFVFVLRNHVSTKFLYHTKLKLIVGSRCRQNLKHESFTSSCGRLRQKTASKSVQHDYFSSFNQSNHWFVASSLLLTSSFLELTVVAVPGRWGIENAKTWYEIYW